MAELLHPKLRGSWLLRMLSRVFLVVVVIYILLPVIVTLVSSFSAARHLRFPITEWSLAWYGEFFLDSQWTKALFNSFVIALGTSLISTISGVAAAFAFTRYRLPFANVLYILILLPLFMPGVVLGLGMALSFNHLSIGGYSVYGSRMLVMMAHSLWATPLVFLLMETIFKMVDRRLIEAAYDLGASPARTFIEIIVPTVATGLISSVLLAFVVSLNEFIMALFLTDRDSQTLPVLMWMSLRSATSPKLAVASVVLSLSVLSCLSIIMFWYMHQIRGAGKAKA
jgi:putative spermidine/putrescine transport system permease protein/spermidine/putrescine transport system permease protein